MRLQTRSSSGLKLLWRISVGIGKSGTPPKNFESRTKMQLYAHVSRYLHRLKSVRGTLAQSGLSGVASSNAFSPQTYQVAFNLD
jgi:hypothetical protein